jgi:hypothetical protein
MIQLRLFMWYGRGYWRVMCQCIGNMKMHDLIIMSFIWEWLTVFLLLCLEVKGVCKDTVDTHTTA